MVLAVNGEIYNYAELRDELRAKGHIFKSKSDSEVMVHAYEEDGIEFIKKLNGMFAFVLWDERSKEFYLGRDRLGIKPLYYAWNEKRLLFSSEIKGILEDDTFPRELNTSALVEYLGFENVFGDKTFFKNVCLLPAGNVLSLIDGESRLWSYWDPECARGDDGTDIDDQVETFREILTRAVERHLISDVPTGCYLSGGFDSTSVATIATELSGDPVLTFTGRFNEGAKYDESEIAGIVARQLHSVHRVVSIEAQDFVEHIRDVMFHLDEPKVGFGSFSQYIVAKAAAEHVKVILTGHGGDELFCGYPIFKVARFQESHPGSWLRLLKAPAYFTPGELPYFAYFAGGALLNSDIRFGLPTLFSQGERKSLFCDGFQEEAADLDATKDLRQLVERCGGSPMEKIQYLYLKTYLPSLFIVEDKIGMAHSLESRTPLCDNEMVDFALSIPPDRKLHNAELKYIVKQGMREKLPESLYRAGKKGFPTPVSKWLRGKIGKFAREILLDGAADRRNIVRRRRIETLLRNHKLGVFGSPFDEIRAHKIWMLMNLELWHQEYIDAK